jgi:hypothetical protein
MHHESHKTFGLNALPVRRMFMSGSVNRYIMHAIEKYRGFAGARRV